MANLKRPELKLGGNMSENFKNFELRFHDYCIQADYRNLAKNPETERADYYKKPLLEISALRSAMPDEALQVIRYTIEPQLMIRKNHGYGWTNYDFITLDLSEAPYWRTDLNSGTLSKAHTNLFRNGKLRSDRRAACARTMH